MKYKELPTKPMTDEEMKKIIDDGARYRKEHFDVKVEHNTHLHAGEGETFTLSITGNGYQWSSITFETQEEVDKAIELLWKVKFGVGG